MGPRARAVQHTRLPGYLGPTDTTSRSRIALASAPIPVTDGDYFECQVWQSASGSLDVEADPKTWFAIVAIEFAASRGAMVKLTADEAVADSTDVAVPSDAVVYDTDAFWSAGNPTRFTVPAGVSKFRPKTNIDWTFGGAGYRHVWIHKNGGLAFGAANESDEGDAGVQSIGSAVVDVAPGDRPPDLRIDQERRGRRAHLVRHRGAGWPARSTARFALLS